MKEDLLASDADKAQLWAWNKAQLPQTIHDCVHALFEQQAAIQPDAIAVDAWDGSFTYRQLDSFANQIGHYLVQHGVGPDCMVPLCFEKSCWAVAALMGVLKAGGALVFVDPANPQSRREEIMSQINADFVVTSAAQANPWESMGIKTILVNQQLIDSFFNMESYPPQTGTTPEHLLYVIFTSGSTGKPKGCLIQHKAFLSGAVQHSAKGNLTRTSRVMQLASYSFDVSMLEILTSLISGATVCTPGDAVLVKGLAWVMNSYRINWTFLTPSMVKLLKPEAVPDLKTLSLGGEPLHQSDIETWAPCLQLINGYGPTECSVAAAGQPNVQPDGDPANIGRAVGGLCWIVRADDHDELVPIGTVGELLISGPILALGYLGDPAKTLESFIENPAWSSQWLTAIDAAPDASMRFYKTGDLAKFNSDGTIHFIGRKDNQVKLHGLRIELGEIEHNVAQHRHVKHVAVLLPKIGPCQEKLVAVLSLRDLATESQPGRTDEPVYLIDDVSARNQVTEVRQYLQEKLPQYMVPSIWIVIEAWPLLISAKLNRKLVTKWLVSMEDHFYNQLMALDGQELDHGDMSELEFTLRQIYSDTLSLPPDQIPIDRPYLSLGGDSLGALRVLSRCRNAGISLTVEDVLRSSGIRDLAVRAGEQVPDGKQDLGCPIGVSTIQSTLLNFGSFDEDDRASENHPSQVITIRVDETVTPEQLHAALDAVVSKHSTLRTRFSNEPGHWVQTILPQAEKSFGLNVHTVDSLDHESAIAECARLAVRPKGHVFSAYLVLAGSQQLLHMAAHPAIMDSTSWKIILQDLEAHLATGSLTRDTFSHFHQWIRQELGHRWTKGIFTEAGTRVPDSSYSSEAITNEKMIMTSLTLNKTTTALLRDNEVHKSLRTEPQDLILTAILYAFNQGFPERSLPATYTIESGRASDDPALDFSDTIGCFESIHELQAQMPTGFSILDILKRVKDARRHTQEKDINDLKSLGPQQIIASNDPDFEIVFDYLVPVIDGIGPLIQLVSNLAVPTHRNLGKKLGRNSMVDISATMAKSEMTITFVYSAYLQNQERIKSWIHTIEGIIKGLLDQLLSSPVQFTLADFPLLSLTYDGLDRLALDLLPAISTGSSIIEDVYPCSPMQQGLLLSQSRPDTCAYQHFNIIEVTPRDPENAVDPTRFANAWKQVVERHPSLRTVVMESSAQVGLFDQIVLRHVDTDVIVVECLSELEADGVFREQGALSFASAKLPHRLTICHVSTAKLVVKLDINHAIIDGSSIANIIRDLLLAYETRLSADPAFKFSRYVEYTRKLPAELAINFWREHLDGLQPCIFPCLANSEESWHETVAEDARIDFSFSPGALSKFCRDANVSAANVFQLAWALVLRVYTESEDVCFGMISSGRDVPLPGIEDGVGAFLTMLVCRFILREDMSVSQVLIKAAADLIEYLPHQHCGLASIHHAVKAGSSPLFNTIVTFNSDEDVMDLEDSSIVVRNISTSDPTEYALTLDIWFCKGGVRAMLRHWTDHLTPTQARNIVSAFDKAIASIISEPEMTIGEVDLVSKHHIDRLVEFNGRVRPTSSRLIFTHFEENTMIRPHAPALNGWDGSWTYKELDDITNRFAHYLRTLGVGPEVIVPHCFPKSCWAIITMISIVKAGGAFVGLDFTHPVQRLKRLVNAVDASVICTTTENAHLFKGVKHLVIVNRQLMESLPDKLTCPCPELQPSNAACVVFTSGTTGEPKAIVIEHASMASSSDLMGPVLKLDDTSRVFQFASYTFDVSNQDIFTTLQHGGCVCVPSEDDRVNDPGAAIERLGANWANLTSTVMSLIQPTSVPSLKRIFQLGEPLARETKDAWADAVELYNTYGPAEAAVTVTCTDTLTAESNTSNVGRAPGCWAWVVSATNFNKLVPLGAVGELVLEGPLLARLYLKNPGKTADAFVVDPEWVQKMTPGHSRRVYRTGDLCRFNSNGTLSILGRRDSQVKINGQRVELDEIAHHIQSELGGRTLVSIDAMHMAKISRGKNLVAFIQFLDSQNGEGSFDESITPMGQQQLAELDGKLRSRLPQYMVPSLFLKIKETPRTANGKLDRFKLREIAASLSDEQLSSHMHLTGVKKVPVTEDEKFLQVLWSKVLDIPPENISLGDDFFRLGGDSVAAMSLVSVARAEGVSVAVADMFAEPLLSDMALTMRKTKTLQKDEPFDLLHIPDESLRSLQEEAATKCGVTSEAVVDLYPCSPLQEALMALSIHQQGTYKAQRAFRITDENFDMARFKHAWDVVAKSETILRTRIINTQAVERPLQVVLETDVEWIERDNLEAYIREDRETPTTYGGPLWRPAFVNERTSRYFVWSAHHVIYDAWSSGILFDQISRLYNAGDTLTTKSAPFKGFIRYLESVHQDDATAYWLSQFPEATEEPAGFPTKPAGTQQTARPDEKSYLETQTFSPTGISVATVLRAAWALVVTHYSDNDDVVFAETLSGRNAPVSGIPEMNGPAITTVPVRIRIDDLGGTTKKQYLEAVQAQIASMTPFQHMGLQNIKRMSEKARSAIDNIAHLFVIQPSSFSSSTGDGVEGMEVVINDLEDFDTFGLVMKCYIGEKNSITLEAQYDKSVLSSEQIRRLLRHYDFIIQQICKTPSASLGTVNTISPGDLEEIKEWNRSLPDMVNDCVHFIVAQRAAERPEAETICAWDGSYTYHELEGVTDKLAAHLQGLGVGPEVIVGLCFDKSKFNALAMLAVLKAGGAFTQLSPTYPKARSQEILQSIDASIVLCSPHHQSSFIGLAPHCLKIDQEFLDSLLVPTEPTSSNVQAHNTATVVFTSGTTGKPKGIAVEHRNMCSMQHYEAPHMGIDENTRTLQFAAHVFDNSNSDVFTTLMRGGCVCIPSEQERLNDIAHAIGKYNVNWCCVVPTVAESLDPDEVPTLKYLALGGERVRPDLHERWARRVKLLNVYGPAECTINTSTTWLQPSTSPSNIGRGLGCRTWVTDKQDHNRLVPIGCVGELCIEGPIVTRGYHKEPEKTSQSYVNRPAFADMFDISDMRMYKTGDLVRYDADGSLLYMGRDDTQVKLHGQRIECSEVEYHIVSSGFTADSVVVDMIYQTGDAAKPALAAFVKLEPNDPSLLEPLSEQSRGLLLTLQRKLRNTLHPFMVPSLFICLGHIPVTQTGKTDRKAVRELGAQLTREQLQHYSLIQVDTKVLRELTYDESQLRGLWARVLGLTSDSISVDDHFFQLGGDSIWAMRLSSAARQIGKTLLVADIFANPLLCQMAEHFKVTGAGAGAGPRLEQVQPIDSAIYDEFSKQCDMEKDAIADIYPCTPLQQSLIAITTDKPGAYMETKIFNLSGSIDIDQFKAAWQKAADLFPILRTRIILGPDAQALQVVVKKDLEWQETDGSIHDYLRDHNLSRVQYGSPLTSFAIVKDSSKFVWTVHHALYDGVSAAKLLAAVEELYKNEVLPEPTRSFKDFGQYLSSVDSDASAKFWREQLVGGSPKSFPTPPSPVYDPQPSHRHTWSFNVLSRRNSSGIRNSTLLRAAWAMLTAQYVGSDDVVFGTALSGRDSPLEGIEDIMGPTVTTVPIRVRVDKAQKVVDFLSQVQSQANTMIPYQHAGLHALRRLGPDMKSALNLRNLFVVQHDMDKLGQDFFLEEFQGCGDLMTDYYDYSLVMECILGSADAQGEVRVTMDARYDAGVISTKQMDKFCRQFRHVFQQLGSMVHDETLLDVQMVSPADLATLNCWNERLPWVSVNKAVHDIIAEQVHAYPADLAIVGWDGEMLYSQLDEYSTRVAKVLVSHYGVGLEDIVPVCFSKSKWAVVAMLGVLKAGGVVAHLGVSNPHSRNREILDQTDAKVLLVSSKCIGEEFAGIVPSMTIDEEFMARPSMIEVQLPMVSKSNAAYILFTSGSTGRPKGIVVEHGNLTSSTYAHGAIFEISRGRRVFQFAAYTFDISCADILTTLQRGGTICMPSEEERVNDLTGAITKYRADWMFVTPTVAQLIDPASVPTLRTLVLGGEAPTAENIKTWAERLNLIHIWGPAETTIYASATPRVMPGSSARRLGPVMGCHTWLCDPEDVNKLVPVGCVGEIVVDGPIVSRGYLRDEAKTKAAYVYPTWAPTRRMYKTGDMARYEDDGVMSFVGRKDDQVKVRGQRVELKEVEYHLLAHHNMRHAVAYLPPQGLLEAKLVAVLCFSGHEVSNIGDIVMLGDDKTKQAIRSLRQALEDKLPSYMVPAIWIGVEAMPLTAHGKTDRNAVAKWIAEIDQDTYQEVYGMNNDDDIDQNTVAVGSPQALLLQSNVSKVLGLSDVQLHRSFLGLGGDSITAMQLRTKLRAAGIDLSVRDILQAKSLKYLTTNITLSSAAAKEETLGELFELSPIQRLFFETAGPAPGSNKSHFNQTLLLKVNRRIEASMLREAVQAIVSRHSMLRARFCRNEQGDWFQYLTKTTDDSYNFKTEELPHRSQLPKILRQRSPDFDINQGPLFSVHLFQIDDRQNQEQLLLLSAHHLVIDVVSWLVILGEMEDFLTTTVVRPWPTESPFSFQTWLHSQKSQCDGNSVEMNKFNSMLDAIPTPDLGYWNMGSRLDTYGDVIVYSYELSEDTTMKLLLSCSNFNKVEVVDVVTATLLQCFSDVFSDRLTLPTIYSEGHGRETGRDYNVDPSGTVGWFTTITPLYIPSIGGNIDETVQAVTNARLTMKSKGPHFSVGRGTFGPRKMEILLNYLGQSRQLEMKNALFLDAPLLEGEETDDNGADLERLALLEVSALVAGGKLKMTLKYNKNMKHQQRIVEWMEKTRAALKAVANGVGADRAIVRNLDDLGISMNNVEEIVPCVPLQQHMILALEREPGLGLYEIEMAFYVTNEKVDTAKLGAAWQRVVDRHSILRTVLVPSEKRRGFHDQIVLVEYEAKVPIIECIDLVAQTQAHRSVDYQSRKRPHQQFTIFLSQDGQKVAFKLEIAHTLNDGVSTAVILRDLQQAYRDGLRLEIAPAFSHFVLWQDEQITVQSADYWQEFVRSMGTQYPQAKRQAGTTHKVFDLSVGTDIATKLRSFCSGHGITMATFFQVAWGLVLAAHTGNDRVLFGYMTANRDASIQGVDDMAGPLVNMLLCRVDTRKYSLRDLLIKTQSDFLASLEHQYSLVGSVPPIWNSVMSLQYLDSRVRREEEMEGNGLRFEQFWARDSNEWDITIGVQISSDKSGFDSINAFVGHWSDALTEAEANRIKQTWREVVKRLMTIS